MSLSTISIHRPVLTIVMNLVIILLGAIGFNFLGVREFPSIDPPTITVRTNYVGANADIIESQITEPLEKTINGIAGIRSISSSSNQGSSQVTVEFEVGADMETAVNDVRDKVSQAVRLLPQDIDGLPIVSKSDANSDAILSMTLRSDSRTQLEVSDYAENVIGERLQTIPGVSNIQIWGQKRYAMRLRIDPAKVASFGLALSDIQSAVTRENLELPSGKIAGNDTELTIKTSGLLTSPEDFNDLIVKKESGQTIRIRDIGYAELGAENEETILKESGVPMIGLALVPQPGANYLDISDEFYRRYEQIKKELPKDYEVNIALDNTTFVKQSVKEVQETLLIAILLVILIIFLFFRDWMVAFRPLIDLPVSLIGSFFIMYLMGYSINVLSLLAIVLATGLVVDDGIVVTENIYKKIEAGMSPVAAAIAGTNEIIFVVLSTSVTLASVFMPVIFMQGFVGRLFQEFGVVLAGSVLISAFVSLTLTPMLNAYFVRKDPHKRTRFYLATEPFFERLNNNYRNSLTSFLQYKWVAFLIVIGCGFVIYHFGSTLQSELAPMDDRGAMRVVMTLPEGTSYEYTDAYVGRVQRFIADSVPERDALLSVTAPGFTGSGSVNIGFIRIKLKDVEERERTQQQIAQFIMSNSWRFPEGKIFVIEQQTISTGNLGGLPVQYVIQAPDFNTLQEKLPKFLEEARKDPAFQVVDVNLKFNKPEFKLTIDREKAKDLGVSVLDVAQSLQLSFSPQRIAYFNMNGRQYQVICQFDRQFRDSPLDLQSMFVRNSRGDLIQLDNIVSFQEQSNPPQLYHYNRYSSATVSAALAPGKTIAEGISAMDNIRDKVLDKTFSTALTGASRDFAESSSSLSFAFGLALLLVYLILSAQFESFRDPLIIMFTVPMALAGALFSLWYFNQTLNIFSQIGMIMLIGLVTKNGILIVEFANQKRENGMPKWEAVIEAAVARLRPILMTSLATALGALPIAASLGASTSSRMGMGIVVMGGILISLSLTLFIIPAMYLFISKNKHATKVLSLLLLLLPLSYQGLNAQSNDTLTTSRAVELAIQQDIQLLLIQNASQQSANLAQKAMAGFRPELNLNAAGNYTLTNINQKLSNGNEIKRNWNNNLSSSAGLEFNWLLYDGNRKYATLERLGLQAELTSYQQYFRKEDLQYQTLIAYYNLQKQLYDLKSLENNRQIYDERVKLANIRLQMGKSAKTDLLQAEIDLNNHLNNMARQTAAVETGRSLLNNVLQVPLDTVLNISLYFPGFIYMTLDELKSAALANNPVFKEILLRSRINEVTGTEIEASKKPMAGIRAGYNYNFSASQAGFLLNNQNYGPYAGVYASWNLYDGGQRKIQLQNITIQRESFELEKQNAIQAIESGIQTAWINYQNALKIYRTEEISLDLSNQNLQIVLERYRLEVATVLELKEAQRNYEDALLRSSNAKYSALMSVLEIMLWTGEDVLTY